MGEAVLWLNARLKLGEVPWAHKGRMMARIVDVAREAGVSPTTVSRYLNNHIELPITTRARIDAAIKRLNYRPNLLAKRLSTGKSEMIGIVTPEIANPFFTILVDAIADEAEKHGFSVLLTSTRGIRAKEIAQISRLEDRHVDGLILMTNQPDDGTLASFLEKHRNIVLLDEDVPGFTGPKVFVENEQGAWLATRHLIEAGHRKIAHVGGPVSLMSTKERFGGFRRAMEDSGLDPTHVLLGAYTRGFGAAALREILSSPNRPTAIFAGSDFVALGIMQELLECGLQVPADISLVGFDDMPFAGLLAPPLTTVRQPVQDLGRRAFLALLGAIENRPLTKTVRLPTCLVERQSVALR